MEIATTAQQSDSMTITVSVINHNSVDTLPGCLEALMCNLADLDAEVFVVDNLCEQRVRPLLAREFPTINVIQNQDTLGFGANHNQVIALAKGRYVLALNPDVFLPETAVKGMIAYLERYPMAAVCGLVLTDLSGTQETITTKPVKPFRETVLLACYISNVQPNKLGRLARLTASRRPNRGVATRGADVFGIAVDQSSAGTLAEQDLATATVPQISGACMLFRRSALQTIGGFDERFFLYFEETDWCLRATSAGFKIGYLEGIRAVHIGGTSTRPRYLENLAVYVQSALRFYDKHRGNTTARLMRLAVGAIALLNLVRWSALSILRKDRRPELAPWITFARSLVFSTDDSAE